MANQGLPQITPEERKANIIIAVAAIVAAIIFAVVSFNILPERVATQPAMLDTGAPTVSRFVAILLPFGISVVSAISAVGYRKQFLICLVGYVMNILFWISN